MKIEDVFKLVEAGFSKEEIIKLSEEAEVVEPAVDEPVAEPEPVADPEPAAEQEHDSMAEILHVMQALTAQMNTLTRALQASNILGAEQRGSGRPQDVDEILANIINPHSIREEIK